MPSTLANQKIKNAELIRASASEVEALEAEAGFVVQQLGTRGIVSLTEAVERARGMCGCGKVGIYRLCAVVEAGK